MQLGSRYFVFGSLNGIAGSVMLFFDTGFLKSENRRRSFYEEGNQQHYSNRAVCRAVMRVRRRVRRFRRGTGHLQGGEPGDICGRRGHIGPFCSYESFPERQVPGCLFCGGAGGAAAGKAGE